MTSADIPLLFAKLAGAFFAGYVAGLVLKYFRQIGEKVS